MGMGMEMEMGMGMRMVGMGLLPNGVTSPGAIDSRDTSKSSRRCFNDEIIH